LIRLATLSLCVGHVGLIWIAMGGFEGFANEFPLLQADHGIHYRHGLLTSHFLKTTGMTAGYDPGFMSGYPMSIISDLSSTFSDLVMMVFGDRPALGYKIHVFGCASAVPWLIALACVSWRVKPGGILVAVLLDLLYFWTDFPLKYAGLGMLNYLVSIPVGLVCVAGFTVYFERGGFGRWLWACAAASTVFLMHLTSPLVVAPAGLLAYVVGIVTARRAGQPFSLSRHLGLWLMPPIILALNAFWLWPGVLLWSTKGDSEGSFSHSSEDVFERLGKIFWIEPPIQSLLIGLAILGLVVLVRKRPVVAAGLGGFIGAGFGWGYLAGMFASLDSLQPGRQTYAFYSAAAIASGIGLVDIFDRLKPAKLGLWLAIALVLTQFQTFGPSLNASLRYFVFKPQPFLSSRPTARIAWVVEQVKTHVKPGERLLFEETGLGLPGLVDPYEIRHCSAILPSMAGIELIGGPYLHSTVTTNFTQFGEKKLFEKTNWDLDYFVKYAKLYRPSAICCFSPKARTFCKSNPNLIQIVADDGLVLVGRVVGFEGSTIKGKANVEASPNRLVVRDAQLDPAEGSDGLVVLRYHFVPYLKASPTNEIVPVKQDDDPVPFIGLRPTAGPVTIEMVLPPRK
jgi:hypothetical protein